MSSTPQHWRLETDAERIAWLIFDLHGSSTNTLGQAPMRELNDRLIPLHQRLFVETSPAPVKWAMAEMGLIENGLRLPLVPLSEKSHQTVREALHAAGISLPGLRIVEGRG